MVDPHLATLRLFIARGLSLSFPAGASAGVPAGVRGHRRSLSDGASPLTGMAEEFCRTAYTANPPSRVQRACLQGCDPPSLTRKRPPPIKLVQRQ